MTNKALERAVVLSMRTPAAVKSGQMLVFGAVGAPAVAGQQNTLLFGIATEDATDAFGNVKPFIGVDREGAFNLAVQGEFGCPLVLHGFKPGDPVYADINGAGSSYDATTNCWTGFTLNGDSGGVWVGNVLDVVTAGTGTTTVRVALRT